MATAAAAALIASLQHAFAQKQDEIDRFVRSFSCVPSNSGSACLFVTVVYYRAAAELAAVRITLADMVADSEKQGSKRKRQRGA